MIENLIYTKVRITKRMLFSVFFDLVHMIELQDIRTSARSKNSEKRSCEIRYILVLTLNIDIAIGQRSGQISLNFRRTK